jgi:hypothetical protein
MLGEENDFVEEVSFNKALFEKKNSTKALRKKC